MKPSVSVIGTRGYPSYYGGFETAVRKLAPYLSAHGWKVTVYGRPGATRPDDPDRDHSVRSKVTRGLENKSFSTLSFGLTASIDAYRKRPDAALVMNVANGFFLPMLKLRGVRTVVNVDGIEWDREKWGRFAKLIFRIGARFTARFADELIFDSHEIGRRWGAEFGRTGTYIPYGGDKVEQLPIEAGLEHRKYVLVVARFVPENSIPEFFDAVRTISQQAPVVIVGSSGYGGALDDAARELADRYPNVSWKGHLSDDLRLLSLWQHAGAYFHGHSVGGTNPTLVQAMAVGAPTVARDTVYNREVLGDDAGLYCEPSAASISSVILELLGNPELKERLSSASMARASVHFRWDKVNESYMSLLSESATSAEELS